MRSVVNRLKVLERNVCIFLCGGEARVPKQLLNGAQVGSVGQQMCGIGMTETVRMDRRIAGY